MLLPGFQDAHVHPAEAGIVAQRCDLHDLDGQHAYVARIAGYAAEHPEQAWILGGGWAMSAFVGGTPDKALIDAVVSVRPVFLRNRDGHGAWVNSKALEVCGVTGDTPDPSDGRIERDANGLPTGTLHEGAMALVERHAPKPTAQELERGIEIAQAHLHALGVTAWQDAIVSPTVLAAYRAVDQRGDLTAKVVAALWWDRDRGDEQIPDLIEARHEGAGRRLRAATVKIMQDGVLENFTGALREPYLDAEGHPTANRGISFVEPAALRRHVTRLDAEGFQVHFHAIGDRAVREALDALTAARSANGHHDRRHHIAHLQLVHPSDIPRFRDLGVVANIQPFWACADDQMVELTIPFLGRERSGWQYPFATLARAGAILAGGSDWTVSTANPLLEIEVAVTRVPTDRRGADPFLPSERLDLRRALEAFTSGSAYVNHLDQETGSLAVGKLADAVVLDRNLFAPDAGPIGEARVLMTLVEGHAVFEDPELEA
jgi:predicted amidohydrolase YtcJ